MISKTYKQLIVDLALKRVTQEQFLERCALHVSGNDSCVPDLLSNVLTQKLNDEIEYVMLLGFLFGFPQGSIQILNSLLLENWHQKHEDIALALQKFKDPSSTSYLYEAALSQHDYLDYDDSFALAIKCIWALGDINTIASIERLRLLTTSNNPIIKNEAEKQLQRNR